jgi:hypothetical protein
MASIVPAVMHAANLLGSFDLGDVEVEEEDELPVDMVKDEEEDLYTPTSRLLLQPRFSRPYSSPLQVFHHCRELMSL